MTGKNCIDHRAKKAPMSAGEGIEHVGQKELGEMWKAKKSRMIGDVHRSPFTKCNRQGVHDVHLAVERTKGEEGGEEKNE